MLKEEAITSTGDPDLFARGCTPIGQGMLMAYLDLLNYADDDYPHAMVLLSDGFENKTPSVADALALITYGEEVNIYTIALGPLADSDLLKDIADQTGGKFYESPTIRDLLTIYFQIQGILSLGETVGLERGVKGSGNDTRTVIIDQGASEATFVVGWLQPEGSLRLELDDPTGTKVYPQVNTTGTPGFESGEHSTYHYIRIEEPMPGSWDVHIIREDTGDFQIYYTFAAFVKGISKLW
ncbi:MAG: vWA domain-containing protein [bacterium]